jgi:hypothetical protein
LLYTFSIRLYLMCPVLSREGNIIVYLLPNFQTIQLFFTSRYLRASVTLRKRN